MGKLGKWLCRIGLHRWSANRGGIKVCLREGCEQARTWGLTGAMRQLQFRQRLYEEYQSYDDAAEEGDS